MGCRISCIHSMMLYCFRLHPSPTSGVSETSRGLRQDDVDRETAVATTSRLAVLSPIMQQAPDIYAEQGCCINFEAQPFAG